MNFTTVPETIEILNLWTTYRTDLRVNDSYDITVKFTEMYNMTEDGETIKNINIEIEEFPIETIPTIVEFQALLNEVKEFVEANTDVIIGR